jgi:hypothetical protein
LAGWITRLFYAHPKIATACIIKNLPTAAGQSEACRFREAFRSGQDEIVKEMFKFKKRSPDNAGAY